ncbi:MAG: FHA domain-containing protein [Kofleriaceae bacterium]
MSVDEMLAQCVAAPDDDAPRLVWADAVGGERGELVVLQCDLARGGLAPAEVAIRRRRELELLGRHGNEWAGLPATARAWTFHRGFVEAVRVNLVDAKLEPFFAAAPLLTSLSIANMPGVVSRSSRQIDKPVAAAAALGLIGEVLAQPAMQRLRALDILEPRGWVDTIVHRDGISPLADDVAALLSAYSALAKLHAFGISGGGLGARGLDALGAIAEDLPLSRLWLRDQRLTAGDLTNLLHRLAHVTSLDLVGRALPLEQLAPILERPLRELAISGTTTAGLVALAASPAAQTLEYLAMFDAAFERPPVELAEFPRLRVLELSGREAWPREPMPALRTLALGQPATVETIEAVARMFGPQLELLDLRATYLSLNDASLVAGEVVTGEPALPRLLHPTRGPGCRIERRAGPHGEFFIAAGRVWEIPPLPMVSIGRLPTCDLVIPQVLPHAATLTWQRERHELLDLQHRTSLELHDGVTFKLGHTQFRYFAGSAAAERVRAQLRTR